MTIDDLIDEIITCNDLGDLKVRLKDYLDSDVNISIVDRFKEPATEVLSYLNLINGSKLKAIGKIAQRLSEGYSVADLKRIIDVKCEEWGDVKKMAPFLKPQTLFGSRNKVDKYLDHVKLDDGFNKKQVVKSRPDTIILPDFN